MNDRYDAPINEKYDDRHDAWWERADDAETVAAEDAHIARWPAERAAAQELAWAQQRLAEAEAGDWTEARELYPDDADQARAEHLGYLCARVDEVQERATATVERGRVDVADDDVTAAAVARAREAIARLGAAGSDPATAEGARADVLSRWHADDQAAEAAAWARAGGFETGSGR